MEDELETTLFTRSYKGLTPTSQGKQFYQFSLETLENFTNLKTSFQSERTKTTVLSTEILFDYLVLERQRFAIDDSRFVIQKTENIIQVSHQVTDYIASYIPINNPNYQLQETFTFTVAYMVQQGATDMAHLPILINSDVNCPFRKKTMEVEPDGHFIEVDSISSIIQLVEAGQGRAILPSFIQKNHQLDFQKPHIKHFIQFYLYTQNNGYDAIR